MTLVAFDFDGTLSADEMIVLLGEAAGAAEEIADVTERAMAGELSYAESLRNRAALLEGVSEADASEAYDGVDLRPGAAAVIEGLNRAGTATAILTGGFETGVERALQRAGVSVDRVVANRLPIEAGRLDGSVAGPLIEETKDEALEIVAADLGVPMAETIAVGDGANDVPMLDRAGVGIGFQPKAGVETHCDVVVASMVELESELRNRDLI